MGESLCHLVRIDVKYISPSTYYKNPRIYSLTFFQILTAVMNEYTDYRHTGENKMVNRDTLLAIFSDARVGMYDFI